MCCRTIMYYVYIIKVFVGDRNLSGNLVAPGRSRYKDNHYRTQVEWVVLGAKSTSKLNWPIFTKASPTLKTKIPIFFTEGNVTTLIARYTNDLRLSDAFRLNSNVEYDYYQGNGENFGGPQRYDMSVAALGKTYRFGKLGL